MQHPTLPEVLIDSKLQALTPMERVLGRLAIGGEPVRQDFMHPVGRHSAAVWLDSGDYQGRHRAAEVAAA